MADIKRPIGPKTAPPLPAVRTPQAAPTPAPGPSAPLLPNFRKINEGPGQRQKREQTEAKLLGEGRIGDESVTSEELAAMGNLVAGRHILALLAKRRASPREDVIREVGELLYGLADPSYARRLLLELADIGRIVDIYPLEVLRYLIEQRPEYLPQFKFGPVVLNKPELMAKRHRVEEPILLQVPLGLKLKAFALEGGGAPGYCLNPGPPTQYLLEFGDAGVFRVLLRGEQRGIGLVDRLVLTVEDT